MQVCSAPYGPQSPAAPPCHGNIHLGGAGHNSQFYNAAKSCASIIMVTEHAVDDFIQQVCEVWSVDRGHSAVQSTVIAKSAKVCAVRSFTPCSGAKRQHLIHPGDPVFVDRTASSFTLSPIFGAVCVLSAVRRIFCAKFRQPTANTIRGTTEGSQGRAKEGLLAATRL